MMTQNQKDSDVELQYPEVVIPTIHLHFFSHSDVLRGQGLVIANQNAPSARSFAPRNPADTTRKRAIRNAHGKRLAEAESAGQVEVNIPSRCFSPFLFC
jgi:hypothetical protein